MTREANEDRGVTPRLTLMAALANPPRMDWGTIGTETRDGLSFARGAGVLKTWDASWERENGAHIAKAATMSRNGIPGRQVDCERGVQLSISLPRTAKCGFYRVQIPSRDSDAST